MNLSPYAIQQLVPYIIGDDHAPKRSGPQLVALLNKYGVRDVYDADGLPDIGKLNGHRPSRKEYAIARLKVLSGNPELRNLLQEVANGLDDKVNSVNVWNTILQSDGYELILQGETCTIQGGVVDKRKPALNEAHFQDIETQILQVLDRARVSIWVVMAWFTNDKLLKKLVEKHQAGIDVQVVVYDDGINEKHGVDLSGLHHRMIKLRAQRGGTMHDKFCVIDNQIVITGSYNWTARAEYRNDENISVEMDPEQATRYSEEFRRLTKVNA